MPLALFVSLLALQDPGAAPAAVDFTEAMRVAEESRLAITPSLDGKLDPEEWDTLWSGGEEAVYLQWEPGVWYVAAKTVGAKDLVLSIDSSGDGWLVGKDNLEVRVSQQDGVGVVRARILDATNVAGPTWIEVPGIGMASRAHVGADGVLEAAISDPIGGIVPKAGVRNGVRVDVVPLDLPPIGALTPRSMSPLKFVRERAAAVPTSLKWGVEGSGRLILPGDSTRMRFTFEGGEGSDVRRLEMRSEGTAKDQTNQITVPFPEFDRKGRAFVDYFTEIKRDAAPGYRVLRGTLITGDGVPAVMQMSYRVAPLLDVDFVREPIKMKDKDQVLRLTYYLSSNSTRRVDGTVSIELPRELKAVTGDTRNFIIYNARGRIRSVFEAQAPAGLSGTFPIKFVVDVGGRKIGHTAFLHIG